MRRRPTAGPIGTGDWSERIRTYNFPQNRVTDHRVGVSVHDLPAVLDGDLDAFIDVLLAEERRRQLDAPHDGGPHAGR